LGAGAVAQITDLHQTDHAAGAPAGVGLVHRAVDAGAAREQAEQAVEKLASERPLLDSPETILGISPDFV